VDGDDGATSGVAFQLEAERRRAGVSGFSIRRPIGTLMMSAISL
jgi:hypothetical protein